MSAETSDTPDDLLDVGKKLFLAGIYLPLAVGLILLIVSFGPGFHPLAVAFGIVTCGILLWLAEALYGGKRTALGMVKSWSALMVLVAIVFAVSGPLASRWVLVAMSLNQLVLPFFVFVPAPARAFLAHRRGEEWVPAAAVAPGAAPHRKVDDSLAGLGQVLGLAGGALLGLAALNLLGGVLMLLLQGVGWLALLIAVLCFVLGNIGMTASEDLHFLYETRGQVPAHLTNSKTSLRVWYGAQLGIALLLLLVVIVRIAS